MSKKVDLWMPLYIGDYLSATNRLTTEQHGAYMLLIMDYWKHGSLPNDDAVLAQITRMTPDAWSNARGILEAFFEVCDKHWKHGRIEKEMAAANSNKEAASNRGKAGAAARWGKKNASSNASSNAQAIPEQWMSDGTSPSPSPIKEKKNRSSKMTDPLFEEFWDVFSDKRARGGAEKVWRRINPDAELAQQIIDGAKLYVRCRPEEKRYWKQAQGWLNDKRWLDEYEPNNLQHCIGGRRDGMFQEVV